MSLLILFLRCVQTANEISKILKIPIKIEPAAMETLDERWYPVVPVKTQKYKIYICLFTMKKKCVYVCVTLQLLFFVYFKELS